MEESNQELCIVESHEQKAAKLAQYMESHGYEARVVRGPFSEENDPAKDMLIAARRTEIKQRRDILDWNQKIENERLSKANKPRKTRKNELRKAQEQMRQYAPWKRP